MKQDEVIRITNELNEGDFNYKDARPVSLLWDSDKKSHYIPKTRKQIIKEQIKKNCQNIDPFWENIYPELFSRES
jgi:hypothetical protein